MHLQCDEFTKLPKIPDSHTSLKHTRLYILKILLIKKYVFRRIKIIDIIDIIDILERIDHWGSLLKREIHSSFLPPFPVH